MISLAASAAPSLSIRPAQPRDQAYVADVMADQLAKHGHRNAHATVNRIIDSPSTRVLIASDDARSTGWIRGWLAYAQIPKVRAVLFVYVPRSDRDHGVARQLVDHAWPSRRGQWIHGGLRGGSTKSLLTRFAAIEMPLEELI